MRERKGWAGQGSRTPGSNIAAAEQASNGMHPQRSQPRSLRPHLHALIL